MRAIYSRGCSSGRNALKLEVDMKLGLSLRLYKRAIALIEHAITLAHRAATFVPAHVLFALGLHHYGASRMELAMWRTARAQAHLVAAMNAVNQALALGPARPEYHALTGLLLVMQGHLPSAASSIASALQLDPSDRVALEMRGLLDWLQQHAPRPSGASGPWASPGDVAVLLNGRFALFRNLEARIRQWTSEE